MTEDLTDFCTWTRRWTICLWNLTRLSVLMSPCKNWQGTLLFFFFFFKMTRWCLGGKTEQVRHCLCTATPSLPASLPICLLARLSAFNRSCFTFISYSVFYIFLHLHPVVFPSLSISKAKAFIPACPSNLRLCIYFFLFSPDWCFYS